MLISKVEHESSVQSLVIMDITLTWIGKVLCLLRCHCNKELNCREEACENPFIEIIPNLVVGLGQRRIRTLQLDMNDRQTIDQ